MDLLLWTAIIVVISLIVWNTSATSRYHIKFALFVVLCSLAATVPIPFMLLRPRNSKNALLPAYLVRVTLRFFGLKCTVKGKENIVQDSGCVVLMNHQSVLDLLSILSQICLSFVTSFPIVLAELWPIMDKCAVIAKKEIFYIWPLGLASWLWGTIFIDRLNAEKAQGAVNETGATIRDKKSRVLMFPEGTRNSKDKLLPFKKGAFHLALASQCPIQPVIVSRYNTFLDKPKFDAGHITITILPSVPTKGLTKNDLPKLMDQVYDIMSNYLQSNSKDKKE